MIDFPADGLIGEKVRVRAFSPDDITDAYIGWLNDSEVTRLSNQRFRTHDRASSEDYFTTFADSPNQFLSIQRREDDAAIGTMTIYADPNHRTADVGIMVGDRSVWGKGYAAEAWTLVIDWLIAQPGIRKVTAGTTAVNKPMIALAKKSGMGFEGARRSQEIIDGEAVDILYFGRFAN